MSAWLLLQYVVIALAVIISAWVVAKKQFPNATRKLRIAIAVVLVRENKPAWLRAIGKKIAPEVKTSSTGCGGCDGCD
jgi:hypothetical protein